MKNVDGLRVFFETFKTFKQEVVQCWRCQRLGHISKNCRMRKRCVKCGAQHFKADCPVTRAGGTRFLKCVLCGGSHPANARKCTVRQAAAETVKKKQELITKHSKIGRETVSLGLPLPVGLGLRQEPPVIPAYVDGHRRNGLEHPPLLQLEQPASENALDRTAFELFGQSWKTVVVSIYQFEKQFGNAPEHERKRLMLEFISGGFSRRVADMTVV